MRAVQERPAAADARAPLPRVLPPTARQDPPPRGRRLRFDLRFDLRVFLAVVAVLAGARLALAPLVERYVNRMLSRHGDYQGSIGEVDVNLWRGAYVVRDVRLMKRSGETLEPFLEAKAIDFSIEWSALLHGALVGEVAFIEPQLNFVLAADEEATQTEIDRSWQETLLALFPFRIDEVRVRDGRIRFRDLRKDPLVDVELDGVQARARNLTNVREPETQEGRDDALVATVEAVGRPLGQGSFWLDLRLDPFAPRPTFDLDAALQGLDLVRMNDFLRAYGNLDVESGVFDLFTELAASQGRITGYVKPFLHDVDVVSFREIRDPGEALQALWEAIAGGAAKALESPRSGQLATRIPIEGTIEESQTDVFATIGALLRNAFIRALVPQVEDSVEVEDAEKKQTDEERAQREEEKSERARDHADPRAAKER